MEHDPQNLNASQNNTAQSTLVFRSPTLQDGMALYQLVENCPPLDLNSSYLYFLQASHFADSCMLAELNGEIVGFVSAYRRPDDWQNLFVWQVAVSEKMRGQGLAKRLITELINKQMHSSTPLTAVSCTISPSNKASQGVFKSLAKQHGLNMHVCDFIKVEHFAGQDHEAEQEYILRAPQNQPLHTFLHL
ncbi:diaminobutyrate acetyltransferase [Thiomicrorhabdus hydrogeniphila]